VIAIRFQSIRRRALCSRRSRDTRRSSRAAHHPTTAIRRQPNQRVRDFLLAGVAAAAAGLTPGGRLADQTRGFLKAGQGTRFGLQVTVDALGATGELDEPVPLDRRLPGDGLLR
jgi:hypothetical protein